MADFERKPVKKARGLRKGMTKAESLLWGRLRGKRLGGYRFRRQHPLEGYIVDFACAEAKVVIEVDGATHGTDAEIAYDARRTEALNEAGWVVHRFWNSDVYKNLDGVCDMILLHTENAVHHG